ncbi:hypothetical protein [Companilactobacillus zhongbaensis]|uniref:hypothetical protein n=1 Tax=Companilactobacillus zhongbaensis TaxID=2486009 RepID=UPI000F79AA6A|nr:hypothetical protein [Companilactobacillus zhongbaensis]
MNNEIKFIMSELELIYDYYQDNFSLKRIKTYILSMPEGTKITKVETGNVPMYGQDLPLPIAKFNDDSDSIGLLQVTHTMIKDRGVEIFAQDSKRVQDLVNRLIELIQPEK